MQNETPILDQIAQLKDSQQDELREKLRLRGKTDLYFLCKGILGLYKMVPQVHKPVCAFISDKSKMRKCAVMPRGFYKTSVLTIGHTIQIIINDPNERVLWVNETQANCRRFLRKAKSYFERNEVFRWLYPEVIPDFSRAKRWSADEIEVPRENDYAEATIEVMGLGAKTSRHFTRIKFDDLVSVAAADSPALMDKAKDELAYAEPLTTNPAEDYIDYIGTRWGNDDVIHHGKEENLFDALYEMRAEQGGKALFPEQYSIPRLEEIKRRIGPYKYSMLYLNDPYDESLSDFKEIWLRWYELDLRASELYGEFILRLIGSQRGVRRRELDVTMTIDPAKGKKRTDARTAITIVGQNPLGKKFLLEAWADHARPDVVVKQCIKLIRIWRPRTVGFETVGFQFMLKDDFNRARDKELKGMEFGVIELETSTQVAKETRIRGLEPDFFRGDFYVRKDQVDFLDEYKKFPTGKYRDILDALAYHPQIWRTYNAYTSDRQAEREEEAMLAERSAVGY